jgi:hypothetical protein
MRVIFELGKTSAAGKGTRSCKVDWCNKRCINFDNTIGKWDSVRLMNCNNNLMCLLTSGTLGADIFDIESAIKLISNFYKPESSVACLQYMLQPPTAFIIHHHSGGYYSI